jgi:hypothetical protein
MSRKRPGKVGPESFSQSAEGIFFLEGFDYFGAKGQKTPFPLSKMINPELWTVCLVRIDRQFHLVVFEGCHCMLSQRLSSGF